MFFVLYNGIMSIQTKKKRRKKEEGEFKGACGLIDYHFPFKSLRAKADKQQLCLIAVYTCVCKFIFLFRLCQSVCILVRKKDVGIVVQLLFVIVISYSSEYFGYTLRIVSLLYVIQACHFVLF